jgi:hypothetical protein
MGAFWHFARVVLLKLTLMDDSKKRRSLMLRIGMHYFLLPKRRIKNNNQPRQDRIGTGLIFWKVNK